MQPLATVAAWSLVSLCVCLLVMTVSPTKTAEPIEMPCGLWTRVGPRNHVLRGGPDPPRERVILRVVLFPHYIYIIMCKQQMPQQHRAADLCAWDSASRRKRGFRMNSSAVGLGRCGLSSEFLDHLFTLLYRALRSCRVVCCADAEPRPRLVT